MHLHLLVFYIVKITTVVQYTGGDGCSLRRNRFLVLNEFDARADNVES